MHGHCHCIPTVCSRFWPSIWYLLISSRQPQIKTLFAPLAPTTNLKLREIKGIRRLQPETWESQGPSLHPADYEAQALSEGVPVPGTGKLVSHPTSKYLGRVFNKHPLIDWSHGNNLSGVQRSLCEWGSRRTNFSFITPTHKHIPLPACPHCIHNLTALWR